MTNAEIGRALFLEPGSVANHMARIFDRLGISRRSQLASLIAQANAGDADESETDPAS
jgi:DNA-binding CsgD family transcriptional regulator